MEDRSSRRMPSLVTQMARRGPSANEDVCALMSTVMFHRIRCSSQCAETIITANRGDAIGSQTIQKSARPWQRSRRPPGALCDLLE